MFNRRNSMSSIHNSLVKKGVISLAAVALVGSTTAVYAAVNATNNTTSGYGNSGQAATDAAVKFANRINTDGNTFTSDVDSLAVTAKAQLADGTPVDNFTTKFGTATSTYDSSLNTAFNTFYTSVQSAASTAPSKDKFIDAFNNAKAKYFNDLDAAKNNFAASVSNLGNNANVTKDQFIGGYNSTRDAYGNKLEQAKNDFAATVSNY